MNNKMSFLFLFALLFVTISCKSEVKSTQPIEEKVATKVAEDANKTPEVREVITANVEEKPPREIQKPAKKEETKKVNSTPKNESNPQKSKVEKKEEKIVETAVKETKTKIETTIPTKEEKSDPPVTVDNKPVKEIEEEIKEKPAKPVKIETFVGFPSHSILDGLLKAHVSASGVVDYASLKSKEGKLDDYLSILENHGPGTTWSRDQKLAFWINAYNAFTIKLILKNYPVASITDLHGGKPWDVKWINLDGKTLSLNNIENDIIRPEFNEPRIHFAVNCAAKSCPPILNAAYKAKSLEQQLESQTKKFVNNPTFNTLSKNSIEVSKIFDWYGVDFGSVASFFLRYADSTVKPSAKVTFKEYDWTLNGK